MGKRRAVIAIPCCACRGSVTCVKGSVLYRERLCERCWEQQVLRGEIIWRSLPATRRDWETLARLSHGRCAVGEFRKSVTLYDSEDCEQ